MTQFDLNKAIQNGYSSGRSGDADDILRIQQEREKAVLEYTRKRYKDEIKAKQEASKILARLSEKELADERKTLKQRLEDKKKYYDDEIKYAETASEKTAAYFKKNLANVGDAISKSMTYAMDQVTSGVGKYVDLYASYMSDINTRIQGTGKTFSSMLSTISGNIGGSQYVKQTAVLENLNRLVEEGIAYNVEQRAFLSTIADDIARTFDAANGTLLRLIRIQQSDSTASRLGMEAYMTRFLNSLFQDTSYLSQSYDSVSEALLEATSTLGKQGGVEFEYTVQKWLGSLSSVGASSSFIQSLAQGIGYLGSGDVSSLSGNAALQNLLLLGANAAGVDYGELLTGGVTDSSKINKLLRGVVTYIQGIAGNSNQVVRSEYARMFGMSVSDMVALLNLTTSDLDTISKNMLSYEQTLGELESQIGQIPGRLHLSERVENMFDNIMAGVGMGIADNAGTYATWLINSLIMDATGGGVEANVPYLGAINLSKTIQSGIVGVSLLGQVGNILKGLSGRNTLSLTGWGAEDVLRRGKGFEGIVSGVGETVSESSYIGGGAGARSTTLTEVQEAATEQGTQPDEMLLCVEAIRDLLLDVKSGNALRVTYASMFGNRSDIDNSSI